MIMNRQIIRYIFIGLFFTNDIHEKLVKDKLAIQKLKLTG